MTTPEELAALEAKAAAARAQAELAAAKAEALAAEAALAAARAGIVDDAAAPEPAPAPAAPVTPAAPAAPAAPATPEPAPTPAPATESTGVAVGSELVGSWPEVTPTGPRIEWPLESFTRHGVISGATGTGKTRTLQLLAEGLSSAGVPVVVTDMKGDLTGLIEPGPSNEKLLARTQAQGQNWQPHGFPVEFVTVAGHGEGVALRASVESFGSILLSKVLGLNDTQESALTLIFHWCEQKNLALIDLEDLRCVLQFLTSDDAGTILKDSGIASATAGVILRKISELAINGGTDFFGEPSFDIHDFLRTQGDHGIISAIELPGISQRPEVFSTFLMWMLSELARVLPEVGDRKTPKIVFFFDEAHFLFTDASKQFIKLVTQTVRLIRSKGVGIIFVTQNSTDIHDDVIAQLGSRICHAMRVHTARDADALKKIKKTFPEAGFEVDDVIPELGTGQAVVSILDRKGRPQQTAITQIWAPASNMSTADPAAVTALIARSPLSAKYAEVTDPYSALEAIEEHRKKAEAEAAAAEAEAARKAQLEKEAEQFAKEMEAQRKAAEKEAAKAAAKAEREAASRYQRFDLDDGGSRRSSSSRSRSTSRSRRQDPVDAFLTSAGRTLGREITKMFFK